MIHNSYISSIFFINIKRIKRNNLHLFNRGNFYYDYGNFNEALKSYEECLLYNRRIDETNFRSLSDASLEEISTNDEVVAYAKEKLIEKIEEKRQIRSCIYYLEEELKRRNQKQR